LFSLLNVLLKGFTRGVTRSLPRCSKLIRGWPPCREALQFLPQKRRWKTVHDPVI